MSDAMWDSLYYCSFNFLRELVSKVSYLCHMGLRTEERTKGKILRRGDVFFVFYHTPCRNIETLFEGGWKRCMELEGFLQYQFHGIPIIPNITQISTAGHPFLSFGSHHVKHFDVALFSSTQLYIHIVGDYTADIVLWPLESHSYNT